MIKFLYKEIKKELFSKKWRKRNKHNKTWPENIFNIENVKVGNFTYGGIKVMSDDPAFVLEIGNFCSIGDDVVFLLGLEHHTDYLSTFPFKHFFCGQEFEAFSKGDIIVDDDVWIGHGSIILSNLHIGQGSIIGAGSVVTKDIPPYAIVGGSPARILKYRFSDDIIDELIKLDFSKIEKKAITENIELLYKTISSTQDAKKICNILSSSK